jgi:hypothetical protein
MAPRSATPAPSLSWTSAEDGYELALDGTTLVARNAKGSVLRSVPSAVRKGEAAERLLAVRDWLVRHERDSRTTVESWMLRSLPIARTVISGVWVDPAWQEALRDLMVRGEDASGARIAGLLRDATAEGIGIVTLDGESRRITGATITIPHPVLLDDLDDSREFLGEVGATQGVAQLFRETFTKPASLAPDATAVDTWSGARFKELRHALGRCASLGFRVSGGFATVRVWEDGVPIEGRFWVGSDEPTVEAETGQLVFADSQSRTVPLRDVGPVAWSEGARMAELIAAGRIQDEVEAP